MHQVLQVVNMKSAIFWDLALCGFVEFTNVLVEPAGSTSRVEDLN
jgi:hypothetical protein